MARVIKISLLIILLAFLSFNVIHALDKSKQDKDSKPLEIINITPSGEDVPAGRQITFRFNRPVVPVGRMERDASEIPIKIKPEVKGQWRWIDTTTLALMLDEENTLSLATRYEIKVNPGIKAEDGVILQETVKHTFITERPKVIDTQFKIWDSPGMPVIKVFFSQPVSKESAQRHLFIKIKGKEKSRYDVKVEPDPDIEDIPIPINMNRIKDTQNIEEFQKTWLISPKNELPQDTEIEFIIEPGMESCFGDEKSIENRVIDSLHILPSFTFIGIECGGEKFETQLIKTDKSNDSEYRCNPELPIYLVFSSPIFRNEIKDIITIEPNLTQKLIDDDSDYYDKDYSILEYSRGFNNGYDVRLPYFLNSDTVYTIKSKSDKVFDAFGRALTNKIYIQFKTNQFPQRYYLMDSPVVLEKNADTIVPLGVSNLEVMRVKYDRLTSEGKDTSINTYIPFLRSKDSIIKDQIPIRKMLEGHSGIIKGEIVSPNIYGENNRNYPDIFVAQVTPFHVHVKISKNNSLVWVTDMTTGNPVSGAKVKIYKNEKSGLVVNPKILDEGNTNIEGLVLLAGTEKLDPKWESTDQEDNNVPLFVRVERDEDIALLTLSNSYDSAYSVHSKVPYEYTRIHAWGTTAQGVYCAGDKIQYKIYVREHSGNSFISAPQKGYTLDVLDPEEKKVFEVKDLALSDFGAIHGEFITHKTAVSGWYRFELSSPYTKWPLYPMEVLVTDFTPAPFNVTTEINSKFYQPGDELKVNTSAKFHTGGPYGNAFTRITATIEPQSFYQYFEHYEDIAHNFRFESHYNSDDVTVKSEGLLDKNGNLTSTIIVPESNALFGKMIIENAVMDDRGKYVTEKTTAKYAARDRFVGLRYSDKYYEKGKILNNVPCHMEFFVVDMRGEPVAEIPIEIKVEYEEHKLIPFKYGTNIPRNRYKKELIIIDERVLESSKQPVEFSYTPKMNGKYRIKATIHDSKGREHSTQTHTNAVTTINQYPWGEDIDSKIAITPEKSEYKIGETARYIVKNQMSGANALITIENSGVMKYWVQKLDTDINRINVEVKEEYSPGYFLSVVIASPRIKFDPNDIQNDSKKPNFKMGYVKTIVADSKKQLSVKVNPEKIIYRPGDIIKVNLDVDSRNIRNNEPFELAVVVLNEDVFSLLYARTDYFNPYKGLFTINEIGVQNFNLLKKLVSWQDSGASIKNELLEFKVSDSLFASAFKMNEVDDLSKYNDKSYDLRINFKNVAYWNPSIIADKKGKASIEFEAPDNLTGWRILAMAVTPTDQMGLGEGKFAVTKDTEMRPVMPNQVTEGDSFKAGFSIMNRTDKTRELTVNITAEGFIETDPGKNNKEITQTVTAESNKRTTVWLPLKTKGSGKIKFTAKGGDATDQDGLVHELDVRKMVSLETSATYGTSVDKTITESLQFPNGIRTDVGNVKVSLSPTVIGNVEGAFQYLRDYPYECWEQNLTRAVMASHYQNLKKYMPADFTWDGSDTLPQSMLDKASSHQAPNGGMTYYTPQDQYADPYLSAYTAIAFTWLSERGYKIPSDVQAKLNGYLSNMLKKEEISDFYSKGMASTVRAVALTALAKQGKIGIEDIKKYYPHIKDMDLFGKAHFLIAAEMVKGTEDMQKELFNMILSHADQTGGKFVFSETLDSGYSRILTSSLRTNAAILSSLIAYGKTEQGKSLVGDIPFKIVRYITQTRKASGRWENTQENIFCMNALIEYSQNYENTKPDMSILTKLGDEIMGEARFKDMRDKPVELSRPIQENDPGGKTAVTIEREGEGRLYYSAGMTYAPVKPNTEPVNAGIDIKREYAVERNGEWILLNSPMEIKRGELVRIDLFVSIPAARNFLVVNDPVPGGLEPVNSDLATSSIVDAQKGEYKPAGGSWWFHFGDWSYYGIPRWSFYHRELRHHAAIFYSEYLSPGNYHLSYTAQAIASGEFTVMPVHAEEMYDPDVFGKSGAGVLNVKMENE